MGNLQYNASTITGYTIDPFGTKDIDDGIWVEQSQGGFLVYVAIADPSKFIKVGSHMYDKAKHMLSTRYLSSRTLPMLPGWLSHEKAPLLEQRTKSSMIIQISLDSSLDIVDVAVTAGLFRSQKAYSYNEADALIQNSDNPQLSLAFKIAEALFEKRRLEGALIYYDLIKGQSTNEEGELITLAETQRFHSHLLVQEFMILANTAVARFASEREIPILFRNHTPRASAPDRDEIVNQFALSSRQYQETFKKRFDLWFQKAGYGTKNMGHFGLNVPAYTHFTSPIRRFVDLVNHICIKSYLRGFEMMDYEELNQLGQYITEATNSRKDERAKALKAKAQDKSKSSASHLSKSQIISLSLKDFNKFLKACIRNNLMNQDWGGILDARLEKNEIHAVHIYTLLFEDSDLTEDLRPKVFEIIAQQPHIAVSVIEIAEQDSLVEKVSYEYQTDSQTLFYCLAQNNSGFNPLWTSGKNKKAAQQASALLFLRTFFDGDCLELAPELERGKPESKLVSSPEASANKSPVSIVMEWAAKVDAKKPLFYFTRIGASHDPTFQAELEISYRGKTVRFQGSDRTKQGSKNQACESFLRSFSDLQHQ